MTKAIYKDHYGEDFHWFIGKVVSDLDPEHLGRVQVRVYGIHSQNQDDLPNSHLPWAQCLIPTTEGGISGIGNHAKIQTGAVVFGFFMDGRSCQIPFILGSIHHIEKYETTTVVNPDVNDPRGREQIPSGKDTIDHVLTGGTNAEKIFNFFIAQGYQPNQAAAFVGNFYAESGLDPEAYNPNDKGKSSFGIAQWRGSRQDDLFAFAQRNDLDAKSLDAQLNFVEYELATTETLAAGKIKASGSVFDATTVVSRYYERPEFTLINGTYNSPSLSTRKEVAYDAYHRFAKGN